jgi:hypothetical protein
VTLERPIFMRKIIFTILVLSLGGCAVYVPGPRYGYRPHYHHWWR